jgi:hypothetical protein
MEAQPAHHAPYAPATGQRAQAWVGRVPAWAWEHPAVIAPPRGKRVTTATARHILQTMANRGRADADGNVVDIIGGATLARKARVARATLYHYIAWLERHGLVVVLSRGGVVARGDEARPFNAANVYGIPTRPAGLDRRRAIRREQVMKPTGDRYRRELRDGRIIDVPSYAPDITKKGAQATMWPQPHQPSPQEAGYDPPGTNRIRPLTTDRPPPSADYPRLPRRLPPSAPQTPSSHRDHPVERQKPDGVGGVARGKTRRADPEGRKRNAFGGPCIRHIDDGGVLTDTRRLVSLHERERERGATRATLLQWVSAAEHALRIVSRDRSGNAASLFASIMNRCQYVVFITNADEIRAEDRLRAYRQGRDVDAALGVKAPHPAPSGPKPRPSPPPPPARPHRPTPSPGGDANNRLRAVEAAIIAAGKLHADPLRVLQTSQPAEGWTCDRLDDAIAEIERTAGAGTGGTP